MANWKEQTKSIFRKVMDRTGDRLALPRSVEPLAWAEWAGGTLQKQAGSLWLKVATVLLCAYFLSDVSSLLVENFLPEPNSNSGPRFGRFGGNARKIHSADEFAVIASRNLFNSKGLIPGEEPGQTDMGGAPIKTTLPLNLVGTLILQDEFKSIATIEDRSAQMVYPLRIDDEVPSKLRVIRIEPRKVIFLNAQSNRREYVELPEDTNAAVMNVTSPTRRGGPGVEQVAPTQYNVSRTEVDQAISNLPQVLTQARCVPNFENGTASGYKCFQIVPGSIYDKLGMKDGDVICGLNGSPIGDPGQAFQMFNELKTSNHLELCIKRNGVSSNYVYDIH